MAVTYTREQRQAAKRNDEVLVTLAAGGVEFQGPVPRAEAQQLRVYLREMLVRLHGQPAAAGGSPPPAPPPRS